MPNGKNGVNGPNAQLLVDRGRKSGLEPAVNRPLEAPSNVVEIQQRPVIVAQLNVQVNLKFDRDVLGCTMYVVQYLGTGELRSRSRMKSEMKMPRDQDQELKFLEKFWKIKKLRKFSCRFWFE